MTSRALVVFAAALVTSCSSGKQQPRWARIATVPAFEPGGEGDVLPIHTRRTRDNGLLPATATTITPSTFGNLTLARSPDGQTLFALKIEAATRELYRFDVDQPVPEGRSLELVDGLADDARPDLPEAWVFDPDRARCFAPSRGQSYRVITLDDDDGAVREATDAHAPTWSLFRARCPTGDEPCVLRGDPTAICRRAKVTKSAPLWFRPRACDAEH